MRHYFFIAAILLMMVCAGDALARRMTVEVPIANIRSGPGKQYGVLWKVEKYHPVDVIRTSGKWYYFRDFEGDTGWVFKNILRKFPSVIVLKDKCNVRSGPGTTFGKVFTVDKGVPFRELGRKKEWIHIQHTDGDKGWIHRGLVW